MRGRFLNGWCEPVTYTLYPVPWTLNLYPVAYTLNLYSEPVHLPCNMNLCPEPVFLHKPIF